MFGAIVVLWLGSAPPLPQHRSDIAAWTEAHQLSAVAPEAAPMTSYDPDLVGQIETLLEEARSASAEGAPGVPAGSSTLERAEALLTAHPDLPQAAWLLAECHALEAQTLAPSLVSAQLRRQLLERALTLEGIRAASAGIDPRSVKGPSDLDPSRPLASGAAPTGVRPRDRLFVDGVPGAPLTPGQHHLQIYRGAHRVWASWIEGGSAPAFAFTDPTAACGVLDLADVAIGSEAPRPAPGVRCGRWLAARPAALGGTDIAECAGSRCGRWHSASAFRDAPDTGRVHLADDVEGWPAWASWSLVGVGAVAATGVVLWQAGVFDRSPSDTEFVFTGPSAATYRF